MKIISRRKLVESFSYTLSFWLARGSGYGFPCDAKGSVDVQGLNPVAAANYASCVASGVRGVVEVVNQSYWEPAVGRCTCGCKVVLGSGWSNSCDGCGAEYNGSGQRLAARSEWGEETGELGDF